MDRSSATPASPTDLKSGSAPTSMSNPIVPEDDPQRWRAIATVLAGFAAFLQIYATQPLLPELRRILGGSELEVSQTVSALTAAVALAAPLIGVLADVIGRKSVIVTSTLGLAAASALCSTSHTLHQLIAWRFVQGLFVPGVIAVTIAYIAEEAAGSAARLTANYVTGTVAGGLVGRLLAAIVTDHVGWRYAFLLIAGLTFLCALLIARWLPASRNFQRSDHPLATLRAMVQHLRNPALIASYVVGFTVLFCLVGSFTYINFLLAGPPFHLSTTALGFVFLVYALGIVVTPGSGRFIEKAGHRKALVWATAVVSAGALLTLINSLPAVIVGLAVLSTGAFIAQSSASSHVAGAARHTRSAATGLYVSFYYLGGSAGATLLGYAWRIGHWPACVACVVIVQCAAALIAFRYFCKTAPPADPELAPVTSEIA